MPKRENKVSSVSVIIPVYNRQQYIEEAIQSVLNQTLAPLEIIVVDDGSTDNTAAIVKAFGQTVRYVCRKNGGPAAARNTGLELAQGRFIAFLDSDDIWPADKLKIQISCMMANPDVSYTIGKVAYFLEPNASVPPGFRKELLAGPRVGRLVQAMVARREVFDSVGLFDTHLKTAEDVDWFCRANDLNVTMAIVPEIVLNIRIHETNTALKTTRNNQNLLRVLRKSILRKNAEKVSN